MKVHVVILSMGGITEIPLVVFSDEQDARKHAALLNRSLEAAWGGDNFSAHSYAVLSLPLDPGVTREV